MLRAMKRTTTLLLAAYAALIVFGSTVSAAQAPTWILSIPPVGQLQTVSPTTTVQSPDGTFLATVMDLRYYISGIELVTRDQQVIPLTDVYLLVDLANRVQEYDLGSWPTVDPASIVGLRFHIGVDEARNHLDPTTYPPTHPLAPQNPTMHWGWAAGYRFCTFEGMAGAIGTTPQVPFEIHAVGNDLYTQVEIPTYWIQVADARVVITMGADYANLFTGIEAQWGPIEHGNGPDAVKLMRNFAERVFAVPTSVPSPIDDTHRQQRPQLVTHHVQLPHTGGPYHTVQVYALMGDEVTSSTMIDDRGSLDVRLDVQSLSPGMYMVVATDVAGRQHRSCFVRVP